MALKKYRFLVGVCGPRGLYSNIIRAEDERAATIAFLTESGEEVTEENISAQLRHIREIIPKEDPKHLLDCLGKKIEIGDDVMFIKNKYGSAPKLISGVVEKITGKSIVVEDRSGEKTRIILPADETKCLSKVVVVKPRPERSDNGLVDASGYPVLESDPIVYMKAVFHSSCDGFQIGKVESINGQRVLVNGTKRTTDRIVVINWKSI